MTRLRCANCTASHTVRNSRRRAATDKPRLVRVAVDRLAVHELHHEVGAAVGRGAAVQQAGDVRVFEVGQHLPLAPEAFDDVGAVQPGADDLDGNLLAEGRVDALAAIDRAHAPGGDPFAETPGAEGQAQGRVGRGTVVSGQVRCSIEELSRRRQRRQQ